MNRGVRMKSVCSKATLLALLLALAPMSSAAGALGAQGSPAQPATPQAPVAAPAQTQEPALLPAVDSAQGDLSGKLGPHTRHPEAEKAIEQLKSPYCPGFMLNVCSSAQGAALRDSIEWMAEAGLPSDSIVAWVLANHGDTLLALPPTTGKGLLAWVVPPVAVLLGLVLVLVALKRLRGSQGPRDLPAAVSPEDERRLAEALRQLDEEEESPFV